MAAEDAAPATLFLDDHDAFSRLPYWRQWDALVAFATATGNLSGLPMIVMHMIVFAIHLGVFYALMTYTVPPDAPDWHDLAFKNTLVYNLLMNYLGLNLLYTGPMYGEIGWLRLTKRRVMSGIPIHRGWLGRGWLPNVRRWYDSLHFLALVAVCVVLLRGPPSPAAVGLLAVLTFSGCALLDIGSWIGSIGMTFHWPILWLLQRYAAPSSLACALPGLQIWLLGVYMGCGIAKIGPWWELGFGNEWVTPPPFARRRFLLNLFIRDAPRDFRATAFASIASHATALIEIGAPLLVLLGGPVLKPLGLLSLFAMHIYIVSHFAHADVNALNWLSAHTLYFCHVHHASIGFASLGALGLGLLALDFGYAAFGQAGNTHRTYQSLCYKYWSGNYSHCFYFFSPSGLAKLEAAIANPASKLHPLGPCGLFDAGPRGWRLLSEDKIRWNLIRALGFMWYAQLVVRALPRILFDHFDGAAKAISLGAGGTFGAVFHNMMLHNWLFGIVSHEVAPHEQALAFLHAECAFEEGELTCICVYAFGTLSHVSFKGQAADSHPLRGQGRWRVLDAKSGVVRCGRQSCAAIAASIRRPSDWAAVIADGSHDEDKKAL